MSAATVRALVLNAGTATLKAALIDVDAQGTVEVGRFERPWEQRQETSALLAQALAEFDAPDLIGHRVVHGGTQFTSTVPLDDAVERAIERLIPLAPLHNPRSLQIIRAARELLAQTPAFATFDTAFHSARPAKSMRYALSRQLVAELRAYRYGFHGIAHAALIEDLAAEQGCEPQTVSAVTLQLGSGCSACAVRHGQSVETSMGYSPLEGLVMATRAGSIDPTIVLELVRAGYTADAIEAELNSRSGLLALAGESDVRALLAAEGRGSAEAKLALELFVDRIVLTVGAYFTLLEGQGALVFGGGIGANSAEIRERVAAGLRAWQVKLSGERNSGGDRGLISAPGGRAVYAFTTNEERVIAREAAAALTAGKGV